MTKWWLPDDVVFLEEIPKTSVGKFSKKELRTPVRGLPTADGLIPYEAYGDDGGIRGASCCRLFTERVSRRRTRVRARSVSITPEQLWTFIERNAEYRDGALICRASLVEELRRRGVDRPGRARAQLVRELEVRGWVYRPNPPAGPLVLTRGPRRPATQGKSRLLRADTEATRRRVRRLKNYMTRNVLSRDQFVCVHASTCKRSVGGDRFFTEGQLSHVGKHYDLIRKATPLRIVVVGQEVGGKGAPHITMDQRRRQVVRKSGLQRRFHKEAGFAARNPHMRGTTLALRVLLGLGAGTNRSGEFLEFDGDGAHIFDCFALVNRLLCAAHVRGSEGQRTSEGRASRAMYENCERHFMATMRVLQPTIIVVQGSNVWSRTSALPVREQLGPSLLECELPGGASTLVCTFTHPSARAPYRWDSPDSGYFRAVVKPTLRKALRGGGP